MELKNNLYKVTLKGLKTAIDNNYNTTYVISKNPGEAYRELHLT